MIDTNALINLKKGILEKEKEKARIDREISDLDNVMKDYFMDIHNMLLENELFSLMPISQEIKNSMVKDNFFYRYGGEGDYEHEVYKVDRNHIKLKIGWNTNNYNPPFWLTLSEDELANPFLIREKLINKMDKKRQEEVRNLIVEKERIDQRINETLGID